MKKTHIIFTFAVVLLFLVILYKEIIYNTPMSDNNVIIKKIDSPNNQYQALIFERNINATTKTSYHLSILENGKDLKNAVGNVFISYNDFDVEWISNDILKVNNKRDSSKLKKSQNYKKIKIVYSY